MLDGKEIRELEEFEDLYAQKPSIVLPLGVHMKEHVQAAVLDLDAISPIRNH